MKLEKIAEAGAGAACILFLGEEGIGLGLGAILLADAFGVKL